MKRRSKAVSERAKSRRRKTLRQTRRGLHNPSAADHKTQFDVAQLVRERDEALEREKATAEVLRVISSSPGELEPVFQAMLGNAVRICEASFGALLRFEGGAWRSAAMLVTQDPSRSSTARFAVMHNKAPTDMMCSVEPGQGNETALQSRPRAS